MVTFIILVGIGGLLFLWYSQTNNKGDLSDIGSAKTQNTKVPSSRSKISQNSSNYYLWLSGVMNNSTPEKMKPLLDTIRTQNEWEELLNIKIKRDKNGNYEPYVLDGAHFRFLRIVRPDSDQKEAIQTGKKFITDPGNVAHCIVNHGCSFDDFIELDEDVKLFCEAKLLSKENNYSEALSKIEMAKSLNPDENIYTNLSIEIKLYLNDLSAIDEGMSYFSNDMDTVVHSGKAYQWLRSLIEKKEYKKASELINKIDLRLRKLEDGEIKSKRYGQQKTHFISRKREQFRNDLAQKIKFTSSKKVIKNHQPTTEFIDFCKTVIELDNSNNRLFPERVGDAFQEWGEKNKAGKFYEKSLEYARKEGNENIINRIENKLESISNN